MDCDLTEEIRLLLGSAWWVLVLVIVGIMAWRNSWPWKRGG